MGQVHGWFIIGGAVFSLVLVRPGKDVQGMCLPRWPFSCIVYTCGGALHPTLFVFIWVPLQWHIDLCSPFCGSASIRTLLFVVAHRLMFTFHGGASAAPQIYCWPCFSRVGRHQKS